MFYKSVLFLFFFFSSGRSQGGLGLLGFLEVSCHFHNLASAQPSRKSSALHAVNVVLLCVASRQKEVVDGGLLVWPEDIQPWLLPVQALGDFHHRRPQQLGFPRGWEELPDLLVRVLGNLVLGHHEVVPAAHRALLWRSDDDLKEGALAFFVIIPRRSESKISETRKVRVRRVKQVVDPPGLFPLAVLHLEL